MFTILTLITDETLSEIYGYKFVFVTAVLTADRPEKEGWLLEILRFEFIQNALLLEF